MIFEPVHTELNLPLIRFDGLKELSAELRLEFWFESEDIVFEETELTGERVKLKDELVAFLIHFRVYEFIRILSYSCQSIFEHVYFLVSHVDLF